MERLTSTTAAGVGGPGPGPGYPESKESSPRSRGGDSSDEPFPAAAAAAAADGRGRLRLMCSFGGQIVPRPTDKSLCYLGGETRIVAVDRHATLADVHGHLSRSLLGGRPFTLKYQLPNKDLDSLISVSTDENLDSLVDEYDRIAATSSGGGSSRTSRIRLFLFPAKPESSASSSLGSLLEDSSKSENWFVDVLNSFISGFFDGIPRGISTDSASGNCLVGLKDDSSVHSRSGVTNLVPTEDQRASQPKLPAGVTAAAAASAERHLHDVQSVPDSPMLDKNSSFGSTSSTPSLSNLPPIRVRPDDRPSDAGIMQPTAMEDHFKQMGISEQQLPPYIQAEQQVPIPAMTGMSPSEASSRVFSDDDKSYHGGGGRKLQAPKQDVPPVVDPINRAVYRSPWAIHYLKKKRSPPAELKRDMPVGTEAASYRFPVSAPDPAATQAPPGYVLAQPQMHAPPPPQQPQQPQQPAPQQIVAAGKQHFIHNPATGSFIPIQSYYHDPFLQQAPQTIQRQQQAPTFDPNTGMYYVPMQQNAHQPYGMPPTLVDTTPMLDKNSSFGSTSTSSTPSLSNLPPIRVRPDDRPSDAGIMQPTAAEDHFKQMGISEQQLPPYIQAEQQVLIPAMTGIGMSPSEASSGVFSDDDKSDHGGGGRKLQPPKPVSSSLGAMGPLFRKLDLLLAPEYPLRRSIKHAIKLLKEDLEDIADALVEQSMIDSPNHKAKCWMHEARELSYHIDDVIDTMMLPHTTADGKAQFVHGHKVARLKIHRLPTILKPLARIAKIAELRTLLWEASERYERYQLDGCVSSSRPVFYGRSLRIPVACHIVGDLVGIDGPRNELTTWLTDQAEQQLKVICVVGPAGVGKTALAKQLYRELRCQFECRAFIRVPRKPHMSRLLWGMLSQIQRPSNKQDPDAFSVQSMIHNIRKHLQNKRYFIVIDGLWEAQVWDIMNSAFPKGHNCNRIMITCEVNSVAVELCSYQSVNVLELKPLCSQDSEKLFFDRISVSDIQCPDQLKEVSCRILRESGGLPLATITFAGLLGSQPDNSDLWYDLQQYLVSNLPNISSDDMLKEIINFCYNSLPQYLKTCLLYITMYPEGCTIRKVDLVNQWIAEGFISATTEGIERDAESYFDELVNRGMIQPEKIIHGDEVLSCTVHHIVFDLLMHKSREENFVTAVDYSQTTTEFCMKAHRLSLHFSRAQYVEKPKVLRMSQVRSLAFLGLIRCMPSAMEFNVLRVLILELWADCIGHRSLNLSRISKLFHLRYLKISSHIFVKLQPPIQGLKLLETLEIDAAVSEIDISCLPGLLHLSLQDGTKLPDGIDPIISLQTLQYFDLGKNSEDNIRSLGELINLRDLHITCSTALSDENLKRKLVILASSLRRLANLRSVTLDPGAIGNKTMFVDHPVAMFSTPSIFLQRLELLPPICVFSRLPDWIGELKALRILKIVVGVVLTRDIDILTGLPDLTVLSLCIRQPNSESVVFSSGALPVLKYFKYTCCGPRLAFEEEALPNLQRLKLCCNICISENSSHMISGIEHLSNLKEIDVNIGAAAGAKEYILRAAESWFKDAIHKRPRLKICLNVKNDGRIEEKSRPLGFVDGIIYCLGFVVLVVVAHMLFWY